jgi:hypothetical protein
LALGLGGGFSFGGDVPPLLTAVQPVALPEATMSFSALKHAKDLTQDPGGKILRPTEKLVVILLADCYDEQKGCAWPSARRLAKISCLHISSCRKILARLHTRGVIEMRSRVKENGAKTTNEYRFCGFSPSFTDTPPARCVPTVKK